MAHVQYAEACKQVAQELGLPVVDLYTQLQEEEVRVKEGVWGRVGGRRAGRDGCE